MKEPNVYKEVKHFKNFMTRFYDIYISQMNFTSTDI